MNVQQALLWIEDQLGAVKGDQDTTVDARFLLSHLLDKSFTWIKTWPQHSLTDEEIESLKFITERRQKGEPIAYIVGHRDFWNLTLKCTPASLIPRAETELLVEIALNYLKNFKQAKVLDLGTGTGAIGLAIAKEITSCQVTAVDFSADAVALCEQNKKLNQIENFTVLQSDWLMG
ncbi:MAG: HemK/PrmC family methyltransferase [Enterobacterales bacterium]|nr:HemK/PrmC family methyltransferase [Enterobacterales bacterium]